MTLDGSVLFELNNNKTCLVFYFYYYSQLPKHYNELQRSIQFSLKHVDYNTIIYVKTPYKSMFPQELINYCLRSSWPHLGKLRIKAAALTNVFMNMSDGFILIKREIE